ncbi:MAG: DUF3199 family protein [Bacteroidales bacterium]|nr:DUF3199 family protein [Bacteroidales bacterium]
MECIPWVTPEDVRDYSDFESVKERSDARLEVDIERAVQYVLAYTHNDFAAYKRIPSAVRTAVVLLTEAYARNAYLYSLRGGMKSETFDDYSYTLATGDDAFIDIGGLGLASLLDPFVLAKPSGNVFLRMRKL